MSTDNDTLLNAILTLDSMTKEIKQLRGENAALKEKVHTLRHIIEDLDYRPDE